MAKIEKDRLERVIEIALKDGEVQKRLVNATDKQGAKFFNYVLPAEWFFPDIPMNDVKKIREHYSPENYDRNQYKILFMQAIVKPNAIDPEGNELILNTLKRRPVVEVEVSLNENKVLSIKNLPPTVIWGDIPTPLF